MEYINFADWDDDDYTDEPSIQQAYEAYEESINA